MFIKSIAEYRIECRDLSDAGNLLTMKLVQIERKRWKGLFFTIWGGQAFSILGSELVQFSLIWWLTIETGSAATLAMASLAGTLPTVLLGPFAGALIDRWNRRTVMMVADASIAFCTAVLAGLFAFRLAAIWHIYILLFFRSAGSIFHISAMFASTTLMVPKDQLTRIAGMNRTLLGTVRVVGPSLGALLIVQLPIQMVLTIDIVTALLAISPLLFIDIPQPEKETQKDAAGSFFRGFVGGFRFVVAWRGLFVLFILSAGVRLFALPALRFLPLLVTRHFQGEAYHLGLLNSAMGFGFIAGGVLLGVWGGFKKRIVTSLVGLMGIGFCMLTIGLTPAGAYWLALAAVAALGLMVPLFKGPVDAVIQTTVQPEMQGRVFTIYNAMCQAMVPLGLIICGFLGETIGIRPLFVIGACTLLLFNFIMVMTPSIMNIEQRKIQENTA